MNEELQEHLQSANERTNLHVGRGQFNIRDLHTRSDPWSFKLPDVESAEQLPELGFVPSRSKFLYKFLVHPQKITT